MRNQPCIGDTCGRCDGIRCADGECDIDLGIYELPTLDGQLRGAEAALDALIEAVRSRAQRPDRSWSAACSAVFARIDRLKAKILAAE